MIGINIAYTIMIAFIPDYIPHSQTGAANGTLALMVVLAENSRVSKRTKASFRSVPPTTVPWFSMITASNPFSNSAAIF